MNYGPEDDPLALHKASNKGVISCYARNRDYHDVIKKRIRRIARWLAETTGQDVKIFVDTAPVPEKALAQTAGLGWQGKHTNLVSRDLGSWLFLGVGMQNPLWVAAFVLLGSIFMGGLGLIAGIFANKFDQLYTTLHQQFWTKGILYTQKSLDRFD